MLLQAIYTVLVLCCAFTALLKDLAGPDMVMLLALAATMLVPGLLPTDEAVAGFANTGLLTVAVMFVVAAGINATGQLDHYLRKVSPMFRFACCSVFWFGRCWQRRPSF